MVANKCYYGMANIFEPKKVLLKSKTTLYNDKLISIASDWAIYDQKR